jgi:hypothetical protein
MLAKVPKMSPKYPKCKQNRAASRAPVSMRAVAMTDTDFLRRMRETNIVSEPDTESIQSDV